MMVYNTRPWIAGLIGLVMLIALSCAGGGNNPLTPPTDGENEFGLTSGSDPGTQSVQGQSHSGQSAGLWGIYDIAYDQGSNSFEIMPVRGAQLTLNVLGFLQPPDGDPANLGIQVIDGSEISDGRLKLKVSITHPINIPKMVGFDTMGVLIGKGSIVFNQDPDVIFAGSNDLHLLNPDGWTRWMNPVEFTDSGFSGYTEGFLGTKGQTWTAIANGYKYFAEDLAASETLGEYLVFSANLEKRGAFLPDTTNSRIYHIQFPMDGGFPQIKFQYAIISHFKGAKDELGEPIPEPEISDFPPEANAQEAIYLSMDTSSSTLYYNEPLEEGGGDLTIMLTVYDWQGMEELGGNGVLNQIHSIGFDNPDGLFGSGGLTLDINDTSITEVETPVPHSTQIVLNIDGTQPKTWGLHEILVAVYSLEPDTYGPNFGSAYPESAHLASYGRIWVDVEKVSEIPNYPPVIDEIQGPDFVSCWDSEVVYTCIAHDPNPGDVLLYAWTVTQDETVPMYLPPKPDNTATIDWSNDVLFPPGPYNVWFKVTDGKLNTESFLPVTKEEGGIQIDPISADDDDIYNVECTNNDAMYATDAVACNPDTIFFYRWLKGFGDPPATPPLDDPGWTEPSLDNFIEYDWAYTEIGDWWIVAMAWDSKTSPVFSPYLIVTRIDTPPSDISSPKGKTEVDCTNTNEIYLLSGGEDCDGGENEREWTITGSDDPPAGGWVTATGDMFTVNWSVYPIGTYYTWQRAGSGDNWSVSDPLEVHRNNTPPYQPDVPQGLSLVDCKTTDAMYQAGEVEDCEGDPIERSWALGTEIDPPDTGWVSFTGESFTIDFSLIPTNQYFLYQRASNDGLNWSYSEGLPVLKSNSSPDPLNMPDGPTDVNCYDTASEYLAGEATDCDAGDILTRYRLISSNPEWPEGDWVEFSGNSFTIDWSEYQNAPWFVFQAVSDGTDQTLSAPLAVLKNNAPPEVDPPTGPTDADCTSIDVEYTEGNISDCDPDQVYFKEWYLSLSPDEQIGGTWMPYEGSTFNVDFMYYPSGDLYLMVRVNDGLDSTISSPLHIVRHNTAPDKPAIPDGPTEINCLTNPALYDGGTPKDCDPLDEHIHYWYISIDPDTPTGGTWVNGLDNQLIVDYTGVVAEDTYYLFQKISDEDLETVSDSLAVVYHNTAPFDPPHPSGNTNVSCANDNEMYEGGEVADCDSWQMLTRSWAVSDIDYPPAIGWTEFSKITWTINWSEYNEDTYYLYQRVYDGYGYSYSSSLEITVGPPTLITPQTPSGNENPVCDDPILTYDAGEYLIGCPGVDITRGWAFNTVPTPPATGWTIFTGTTFDIDPGSLGFGNIYLYQRARLDAQEEFSEPLIVNVHPGELGIPPIPVGAAVVDCTSTAEEYDMGDVTTACPDTPLQRQWRIKKDGSPVVDWVPFTSSPIVIDWTILEPGYNYQLLQKADDGDHIQISDPLTVSFVNDEPDFLGSITGPTIVTCADTTATYDGGEIDDCDNNQTITREWALNTIDTHPIDGWTVMTGSQFMIDYSSHEIQPGNNYLFQRADDGICVVYDPVSLHVVYKNTAPDNPATPLGAVNIDCANLEQTYYANEVFDCDGTWPLAREWAVGPDSTPPFGGWTAFIGDSFDVDWGTIDFGAWFLFQRVSDEMATSYSMPLFVEKMNSPPEFTSLICDEGTGPFNSDGQTEGLTGLDFKNTLHFTFSVDDCDGDELDNYWAVTTTHDPPVEGDPAWNGPITGDTFTVDLTEYTMLAPTGLFIHVGSSDGTYFSTLLSNIQVTMWQRIWLTDFSSSGDMWSEHACVTGVGSRTWNYDSTNEYLRLEDYGTSSRSAVWSNPVIFPSAPAMGENAVLLTWMNPALATGLDFSYFSILDDTLCDESPLDVFNGYGCDYNSPGLTEFMIPSTGPFWGNSRRVGLYENGFDGYGCTSSDFWLDWVGMWIRPPK